jgi:SPP1 family predicted phage head-tail adaptor
MLTSKLYNAAGKRNNYLTIERATDATANSTGEVLPEFSVLCKRFASVKPTNGREFTAAMTVQPMLQSILELPYDSTTSTITPRDRVVMGSRTLNIAAVFNENQNNEKIILWIIEPVAT